MELKRDTVRYEHTDINAKGVVWTGVAIGAFLCAAGLVLLLMFHRFARERAIAVRGPYAMTAPYGRQLPPEPRLQSDPPHDLAEMRAAEDHALHTYSWADRTKGTVNIPIDRAIELTAQRGIPPAPTPPPNLYYMPRQGDPLTGFESRAQVEPR